jgi:hypothetical protein
MSILCLFAQQRCGGFSTQALLLSSCCLSLVLSPRSFAETGHSQGMESSYPGSSSQEPIKPWAISSDIASSSRPASLRLGAPVERRTSPSATMLTPRSLSSKSIDATNVGNALFEITPQFGFMGGSTLVGVKAAMLYYGFSLELAADQVIGRYATLFPLTANFVLNLAQAKRVVPFGIVGGGLFLVKPENTVGDETLSTLGLNVGGGLRFYFNSRIGLRFETKQYFTEIQNKSENHPELLIYQSSSLGVIIAFI